MSNGKRVYLFYEGNARMRDLLGGKGANLAEMTNLGLPVPPGFTITTTTCNEYLKLGRLPDGLMEEVRSALRQVEEKMGRRFGNPQDPLLVSVRSGAKFSMPGMMDTILNLGLNDETLEGLIKQTCNPRFGYDAYRRFLMMFSDIVLSNEYPGLKKDRFEQIFSELKQSLGAKEDTDVDAEGLKKLVELFKQHIHKEYGKPFPTDPWEQLQLAIEAVFKSWNNPRAITYREVEKIPHDLGTAVNVQSMVFGNMGGDSGTGVCFTRNPATGEKELYGEFLFNAQGEDVVAGIRTPIHIDELAQAMPDIYQQLEDIAEILERHYREMQDIEFTIERGRLWILQCRAGKRTGTAAVKIAVDMVREGLIGKEEALMRVTPEQLEQVLHPQLKEKPVERRIARGLNAGPGAAVGRVVFDSETAARLGKRERGGKGERVILVRQETNPDDLAGMLASEGVLTVEGGRTSHAALVARQFGIPTIVGARDIRIDEERRLFSVNGVTVHEGEYITIDGTEGWVYLGELPTEPPRIAGEFEVFMSWADEFRRLGVRANADTPEQAAEAVHFGAEGIGLCRTEHMFLESARLPIVRQMILADNEQDRQEALSALLPLQRADFVEIFRVMKGRPVTIRLIDPPLHEFLPKYEELLLDVIALRIVRPDSHELAEKEKLLKAVENMREANPMLGLRGCRLSLVFPGIVEMQVSAIIGAACEVARSGEAVHPEIMIPLVSHVNELTRLKKQLERVAEETMEKEGIRVDYSFGTMIEVPRAALTAGDIAREAAFFSFGTNDLTQMTYGISRDDAGRFLRVYLDEGIFSFDPTETIDREGVGRLMRLCVEEGRQANPNLKLGICGEHGGDPETVKFCHEIGLDYVSCSPRRIPVARLAAAQANIKIEVQRDK